MRRGGTTVALRRCGASAFAGRGRRPRGARRCRGREGALLESDEVLRHVRAASRRERPMDAQTVIALCDILLVLIGIIGLVLMRRE